VTIGPLRAVGANAAVRNDRLPTLVSRRTHTCGPRAPCGVRSPPTRFFAIGARIPLTLADGDAPSLCYRPCQGLCRLTDSTVGTRDLRAALGLRPRSIRHPQPAFETLSLASAGELAGRPMKFFTTLLAAARPRIGVGRSRSTTSTRVASGHRSVGTTLKPAACSSSRASNLGRAGGTGRRRLTARRGRAPFLSRPADFHHPLTGCLTFARVCVMRRRAESDARSGVPLVPNHSSRRAALPSILSASTWLPNFLRRELSRGPRAASPCWAVRRVFVARMTRWRPFTRPRSAPATLPSSCYEVTRRAGHARDARRDRLSSV